MLDFHLGSGTTCTTAHKLNRRYIGIEQLDYGKNDSVVRLQNVLNGDITGISKSVDWQGGGSFVYCELKVLNQKYVDMIQLSENDNILWGVWQQILKTGFISSLASIKSFEELNESYNLLSLDDKKSLLISLLDKNMLYVNLCDIDDEEFEVSEHEKEFSKSFYGKGK